MENPHPRREGGDHARHGGRAACGRARDDAEATQGPPLRLASWLRAVSSITFGNFASWRVARARLRCAIVLAAALAGCAPDADHAGYAEIALNFVRTAGDVYRLNAAPLDELGGRSSAIIREPVGTARLELERYGRLYLLCNFTIRKNRIVTVAVSAGSRGFQCDVRD